MKNLITIYGKRSQLTLELNDNKNFELHTLQDKNVECPFTGIEIDSNKCKQCPMFFGIVDGCFSIMQAIRIHQLAIKLERYEKDNSNNLVAGTISKTNSLNFISHLLKLFRSPESQVTIILLLYAEAFSDNVR